VPIYEFECGECGGRFEGLVPAGTGRAVCPVCGAAGAPRRLSSFAPSRQLTAAQKRRIEDRRGIDRGGARERFEASRAKRRERKPGR